MSFSLSFSLSPLSLSQGIVAYSKEKYAIAMEHFSKALQKHPKSLSSIRVVIASCCFKLKQFDRSRAILEKALASDVSHNLLSSHLLS